MTLQAPPPTSRALFSTLLPSLILSLLLHGFRDPRVGLSQAETTDDHHLDFAFAFQGCVPDDPGFHGLQAHFTKSRATIMLHNKVLPQKAPGFTMRHIHHLSPYKMIQFWPPKNSKIEIWLKDKSLGNWASTSGGDNLIQWEVFFAHKWYFGIDSWVLRHTSFWLFLIVVKSSNLLKTDCISLKWAKSVQETTLADYPAGVYHLGQSYKVPRVVFWCGLQVSSETHSKRGISEMYTAIALLME